MVKTRLLLACGSPTDLNSKEYCNHCKLQTEIQIKSKERITYFETNELQ